MTTLAIILSTVWGLVLFVLRTLIQLARTGATGINGFHGSIGSVPWLAGSGATLGIALTFAAPWAAVYQWPGGPTWFHAPDVHLVGSGLAVAGILGAAFAQLGMGSAWRIGVSSEEQTILVTDGMYAWVRNPIYTFMGLYFTGYWLVLPSTLNGIAIVMAGIGIHLQVRHVEEPHLHLAHGNQYLAYARRVGRYLPGIGRFKMTG